MTDREIPNMERFIEMDRLELVSIILTLEAQAKRPRWIIPASCEHCGNSIKAQVIED
jgi:hypothetical protein